MYWFIHNMIYHAESPEINSQGQLSFNKDAKASRGKGESCQQIVFKQLDSHKQKDKFTPLPCTICKIHSKLTIHLDVITKAIKLIQGNMIRLHDLGLGNSFLHTKLKAQMIKKTNWSL